MPPAEVGATLVKKLIQLNKVIEFLTFHLEERQFQVETMIQRYGNLEGELVDESEKELARIRSNPAAAALSRQMLDDFDRDYHRFRHELARARADTMSVLQGQERKIRGSLEILKGELIQVQRKLRRQSQSLEEDVTFDSTNVAGKIAEEKQKFRAAVTAYDAESSRRRKLYEDSIVTKETKISADYHAHILECTRSLRPSPAVKEAFLRGMSELRSRFPPLKGDVQYCRTLIKKLNLNIFTGMKRRGQRIVSDMKALSRDREAEVQATRERNETAIAASERSLAEVVTQCTARKEALETELQRCKDELRKYDPFEMEKARLAHHATLVNQRLDKIQGKLTKIQQFVADKEKWTAEIDNTKRAQKDEKEVFIREFQVMFQKVQVSGQLRKLEQTIADLTAEMQRDELAEIPKAFEAEQAELQRLIDKQIKDAENDAQNSIRAAQEECEGEFEAREASQQATIDEDLRKEERDFQDRVDTGRHKVHFSQVYGQLEEELEGIEIPVIDSSLDLDPFKEQLSRKQMEIGRRRTLVMEELERKVIEEMHRFRGLAVPETAEATISRDPVAEVDEKIERLQGECKTLFSERRLIVAIENAQKTLMEAREASLNDQRALLKQIADQHKSNSQAVHGEREREALRLKSFHARLDEARGRLHELHKANIREEKSLNSSHSERMNRLAVDTGAQVRALQAQVARCTKELATQEEKSERERQEDDVRFETVFQSLIDQLDQKTDLKGIQKRLLQQQKERNLARLRAEQAQQRDQERLEIDRLEGVLAEATEKLAALRRGLAGLKDPTPSDRPPSGQQPGSALGSGSQLPLLKKGAGGP
jgi:hypothetical protein